MIIQKRIDLQNFSTFGLKAFGRYMVEFDDDRSLLELSDFVQEIGTPSMAIGGGSNMIFCADYPGVLIKNNTTNQYRFGSRKVIVSAGQAWDDFVAWTVSLGLSGVEALSGIPGTVGGAISLNAGAYGQAVKDTLVSVKVYDVSTRKLHILETHELNYWHRTSIFREKRGNDWLILEATFKLFPRMHIPEHPKILAQEPVHLSSPNALRQTVLGLRSVWPDPYKIRNSGSFFLNPTVTNAKARELEKSFPGIAMRPYDARHYQIAVGWLLENAGLKGARINDFYLHDEHANMVINEGTASTGKDLLLFIQQIQATLKDHYGLNIVAEPLLVGEEYLQGLLDTPSLADHVRSLADLK